MRRRFETGFTLMELLVVLAILGLIMGLVGPQVTNRFSKAKSDIARLQVNDLSAALDLFYLDTGRYPSSSEGLNILVSSTGQGDGWNGPYLKKAAIPDDPWGAPYRYTSPGSNGPYDLYSYGSDNLPNGEGDASDILSWQ